MKKLFLTSLLCFITSICFAAGGGGAGVSVKSEAEHPLRHRAERILPGDLNLSTYDLTVNDITASGTVTGVVVSATGALQVGSDYISDITGTGLSVVGGKLTAAGGGESTTVSDTTTINLTLTGSDITADGLYTAGDNLTLTGADFDLDASISLTNVTASGTVSGLTVIQAGVQITNPSDVAYGASWNNVTTIAPSKNAVYDAGFLTAEADPLALLTAGTDNVKDTHIDWGTGASQVNPADFANQDIGDITITTGDWAVENDSHLHTESKSLFITNPTSSSDNPVWRSPSAITISAVHALAMGGTNIVGQLWEFDANGANGATVDSSDITATSGTNANDDGILSNPSIDAGDYVGWKTTSVSGIVTGVVVTFDYI